MDILNYIDGSWIKPAAAERFEVINPATGELLARTPLCASREVAQAAEAAQRALRDWRQKPVQERVQYLFKLRDLLLQDLDDISPIITTEAGKTLDESKAEMVRAIENVEVACGMPTLLTSRRRSGRCSPMPVDSARCDRRPAVSTSIRYTAEGNYRTLMDSYRRAVVMAATAGVGA